MTARMLAQLFPNNHVITDRQDRASVMVYFKKFYLDDVIDGASHIPHPAFVRDGKELDGIYISKFQNVITDGLAYALPDLDPATHIDFDAAVKACSDKGKGFHLMTAMEWGAVALWCQKNGWLPYGNNDVGKDCRERETVARISYFDEERSICRTATGTGPVAWSHNHQTDGIYDLNANVWEWVDGLRLVYGELQILSNRDASGEDWRAIDANSGALLVPDGNGTTPNSVKLDYGTDRWFYTGGAVTDLYAHARFCPFADVTTDDTVCEKARELLYAMGCLPCPSYQDREVSFYANNGKSERIAFRGGRWGQGRNTGVFKTCLDDPRTYSGDAVGFRCVFDPQ